MSNKDNISLVDKGWQEMAAVLDTELPQKEHRKRPLFLFFLFLGLGGLIGIGLNMDNSKISLDDVRIDAESTALITKNQTSPLESSSSTTQLGNIRNTKSKQTLQPPSIKKSITKELIENVEPSSVSTVTDELVSNSKKEYSAGIYTKDNDFEFSTKTSRQSELSDWEHTSISSAISQLSNMVESKLSVDIDDVDENAVRVERTVTPNLPSLWPLSINSSKVNISELPNLLFVNNQIQTISKHRYRLSPYLLGEGIYTSQLDGRGYSIGAGLSYGTRDLELYIESGYSKMKYNRKVNDQNLNVEVIQLEAVNLGEPELGAFSLKNESGDLIGSFDLDFPQKINLLNDLDYLFVSGGVRKRVYSGLSMSGGIRLSKLLNVKNNAIVLSSANEIFSSALRSFGVSSDFFSNSSVIRDYEWSVNLGAEYRVSNRISIGVNYRSGLSDIFNPQEGFENKVDPAGDIDDSSTLKRNNIEGRLVYSF